jgi:hypothetical protein
MGERLPSAEKDAITHAERAVEIENMLLKRAEEIKKERREKAVRLKAAHMKIIVDLKKTGHLKRCRDCKAMKFYLKNGPLSK